MKEVKISKINIICPINIIFFSQKKYCR